MPAQPQVDIVGATDQSLRRASFDGDMGAVKRRCAAGVEKDARDQTGFADST